MEAGLPPHAPSSGVSHPHPLPRRPRQLLTAFLALSRGLCSILRLTGQPEDPPAPSRPILPRSIPVARPPSPSFLPSPRPRVAPVMERASPSPSNAPSNAPSNRATSAPAGPIRAGNIWAPTSAGCGQEVMRSSVAAGTRRSCHHHHHLHCHLHLHHLHGHHLIQEQQTALDSKGKTGTSPPSGAGACRVSAVELVVAGDSKPWGFWQQ